MPLPSCSAMHLLMYRNRHCTSSYTGYQCRVASRTSYAP